MHLQAYSKSTNEARKGEVADDGAAAEERSADDLVFTHGRSESLHITGHTQLHESGVASPISSCAVERYACMCFLQLSLARI